MSDEFPPVPAPAASGLSDNTAGALAYVTIIPAIIFLVVEPYNRSSFIKFHAWQSLGLAVFLFVLSILNVIPILGQILFLVGALAALVFWLLAIIKASQGGKYKIPFLGDFAEKQAGA